MAILIIKNLSERFDEDGLRTFLEKLARGLSKSHGSTELQWTSVIIDEDASYREGIAITSATLDELQDFWHAVDKRTAEFGEKAWITVTERRAGS